MTDPNIQKFEKEIEQKKLELKPIQEALEKKSLELKKARDELKFYRLEHKMFYPIEKLSEFKEDFEKISEINFVVKDKNGKLDTDWLYNDEIFVFRDGHFYYSSYEGGIIEWDDEEQRYVHLFHHSKSVWPEVVGFLEICFKHPDKYDVAPPDVPYSVISTER